MVMPRTAWSESSSSERMPDLSEYPAWTRTSARVSTRTPQATVMNIGRWGLIAATHRIQHACHGLVTVGAGLVVTLGSDHGNCPPVGPESRKLFEHQHPKRCLVDGGSGEPQGYRGSARRQEEVYGVRAGGQPRPERRQGLIAMKPKGDGTVQNWRSGCSGCDQEANTIYKQKGGNGGTRRP